MVEMQSQRLVRLDPQGNVGEQAAVAVSFDVPTVARRGPPTSEDGPVRRELRVSHGQVGERPVDLHRVFLRSVQQKEVLPRA
jgi:hypothetical protein